MRTKRVNRYYCDFCKKSGGSARHIKHHEERCTMNPSRDCGVCGLLEECPPEPAELAELLNMLPDPMRFEGEKFPGDKTAPFTDGLADAVNQVLPAFREAAHNCPACILAAIRQRGIPPRMVTEFDFTREMRAILG